MSYTIISEKDVEPRPCKTKKKAHREDMNVEPRSCKTKKKLI